MLAHLLLAALACLAATRHAAADGRHAALLVDANTGAVLHDMAGSEPRHPASLTKMMTLYLVFEAIEQGRISYTTRIKISQEAASAPPSKLDLDPGEEITTLDAIKALITKSANDVAIALAEHLGGTESRFVALMNQRARQLGMSRSTFRNASGLPDPSQVTTAQDMITLALRLQDEFPRHYALFQTRHFAYQGDTYKNHNTLLFNYQGTDGIKTGYTRMSGFNLVASVRRDGKHVVGAVFGGGSAGARDAHMRAILGRALGKASTERTRRTAPMLVARAKPVPPQPVPVARPRPEPRPAASAEVKPPTPRTAPQPAASAPNLTPPQPVEVSRGRLALRPTTAETLPPPVPPAPRRIERVMVPTAVKASLPPASASTQPAPSNAARGAPPSSLQAQAERLALGGPAGRASAPMPPAQPDGALHIQVGAYATSGEAEKQIAHARTRAGGLLSSHAPLVAPVQKDSRHMFRARFIGFTPRTAAAACLELRRLGVDCFVMRAE